MGIWGPYQNCDLIDYVGLPQEVGFRPLTYQALY